MNKELEALEIICGELVEMDLLFIDANGTNQQKWFQTQAYKNNIKFQKKYGSPTSIIETALKALEILKKFGLEIYITELNAFVTSKTIKGIFNAYIYITDKKDEIELLKSLKEILELL